VSNLDEQAGTVDVYWRPGCRFCTSLRRDLKRRGIPSRWHNIWTDDDARQFVRSVNNGNETVPTVRIGARTLSNPRGAQILSLLPDPTEGTVAPTAHSLLRLGRWRRS